MKIGLLSLGCPKNLVDSEVMLGLAQADGLTITHDPAAADVLVVNTCAFIDRAREESVDAILEMAAHKSSGRCRQLIVTGCLAERYRAELQQEIPEIDVVLGTGEVPDIVRAIRGGAPGVANGAGGLRPHSRQLANPASEPLSTRVPAGASTGAQPLTLFRRSAADPATRIAARHRDVLAVRDLPTYIYDAGTPRVLVTPGHYAYVKIAEGCDYNCAFCIIPTLRGQYRSRAAASITEEARRLARGGVRELLLISQDTTFYGVDRGERGALAALLRDLNEIEDLAWIRLLYLYPTTLSDAVLDAMAELPKVCRYVDLPLQHSAESVLRRMRRPIHRGGSARLLDRIRERVPGVALRTTVIVGFPGETEQEFEDLCRFVEQVGFDHLGVFQYSHEEGTAAHALADDVPPLEKRRREEHLMAVQRRWVERHHRARIGTRATLLVDGPSPEHSLVIRGRLEGHAPDIDPVVYLTDCDPVQARPGTLMEVEIEGANDYDLVARPLKADGSV